MKMYGKILTVPEGSLADELELVPGDKILEINGMKLRDIIDDKICVWRSCGDRIPIVCHFFTV